ncbi:MAG: PASTA domain-containing protein [Oscillospiraceae bacterium]|nr:PASTA domain-containing protein [Oscillospiraceae bacterium]
MKRSGPTLKMKNRLNKVTLSLIIVGFLVLIFKIGFISIINGKFYREKASAQQTRDVTINPNRGSIYDSNLNIIAQSATVWTVFISPQDIKTDDMRNKIVDGLSSILDIEKDIILDKSYKKNYYEIIKKKIEKPIVDEIRTFIKEEKIVGIHLVEDTKRYYPKGNFASNIIGFTGSDNQGLYGLEAQYEDILNGEKGRIVSAKNAKGNDMPFGYEKLYDPKEGKSIVLTIDENIQHFVEKALNEVVITHKVQQRAAAVAMDVNTGEILAMATKPDFNLNEPFEIFDEDTRLALQKLSGDDLKTQTSIEREKQWKNKLITEPYEPGSVFKVVTASGYMEEGLKKDNHYFSCPGYTIVSGVRMKCWKLSGHGSTDFAQAMIVSCNPAFVEMGTSLGANKFYKYFRSFGLTEKTGIDLPGEVSGIHIKEKGYGPVEIASSSFGQSNKVTAMQMITAFASTINGGYLLEPFIVKSILDKEGNILENFDKNIKRQVISKKVSDEMKIILEKAVSSGGSNAYVKGYNIGGKSGTSEKLDGSKTARISSFAGFAPADNPRIAVLVMVDEPGAGHVFGNVVAAPVVANIMKDILPYMNIQTQFTEEELKTMGVIVPNLIGDDIKSGKNKLQNQGLNVRIVGSSDKILKQTPDSGTSVPKGSTVILYTQEDDEETVTVPNFIDLSPDQANKLAINSGLNIKFVGGSTKYQTSKVFKQDKVVGTVVKKGSLIVVDILNSDQLG